MVNWFIAMYEEFTEQVVQHASTLLSVCGVGWFNLWAFISQCITRVQSHPAAPDSNWDRVVPSYQPHIVNSMSILLGILCECRALQI